MLRRQLEAARSAASLPGMRTWLGIQIKETLVPDDLKLKTMLRMAETVEN